MLGDFALDLEERSAEEIRDLYEAWTRHALIGAPRLGTEASVSEATGARRDWLGLRQFVCDPVRNLAIDAGEEPIRVTLSIGVAQRVPGEDAKQWLERADRALYGAKELGRDRVVVELGPRS